MTRDSALWLGSACFLAGLVVGVKFHAQIEAFLRECFP